MKRIITAIIIIGALFSMESNAQIGPDLNSGIGVVLPLPVGDFSDVANTGIGGAAIFIVGTPVLDFTSSIEYVDFGEKELTVGTSSGNMIGISAGARISAFPLLYAGVEFGHYWINQTTTFAGYEVESNQERVAVIPNVGIQLAVFDVSIRYAVIDYNNFVELRAAFIF